MEGQELRRRRRALDVTQSELAARFSVRQATISDWERGKSPISHPGMLDNALCHLEALKEDQV